MNAEYALCSVVKDVEYIFNALFDGDVTDKERDEIVDCVKRLKNITSRLEARERRELRLKKRARDYTDEDIANAEN